MSPVSQPLRGPGEYEFLFSSFPPAPPNLDFGDIDRIEIIFSSGVPPGAAIRISTLRTNVAPVPTMSRPAAVVLALLLGLAGVVGSRRAIRGL